MNRRTRQGRVVQISVLTALLVTGLTTVNTSDAFAAGQKTTIGVAPFKSTVPDISAPVARNLFIRALAKTSQFAIPPQKASNKIVGVEYIVDGTILEAKATPSNKTNAMTFLRGAMASNLISFEVRVFDARTMALIDTISTKSADINKSSKFGAEDVAGLLGALSKGGLPGTAGNASENAPDVQQMEQRLEPLVTDIANQIAARYGAGAMQGAPPAGFPFGLMPDFQQQQQPAQNFAPSQQSQRGRR